MEFADGLVEGELPRLTDRPLGHGADLPVATRHIASPAIHDISRAAKVKALVLVICAGSEMTGVVESP
ncbi:hypothetical protein GCM10010276_73580 [Streptomyces longisporus]|uniref:Uncharacterized protein n=1 Tax=Streptomyces longisporus TaxID=1948 RepID=A0ABN3N6D5_STRLO